MLLFCTCGCVYGVNILNYQGFELFWSKVSVDVWQYRVNHNMCKDSNFSLTCKRNCGKTGVVAKKSLLYKKRVCRYSHSSRLVGLKS